MGLIGRSCMEVLGCIGNDVYTKGANGPLHLLYSNRY